MKKIRKYISWLKFSKFKNLFRYKKNRRIVICAIFLAGIVLIGVIGWGSYKLFHLDMNEGEYLLVKKNGQKKFSLPILTYHHLQNSESASDEFQARLSLSPNSFEEELKYLNENGFTTIISSELNNVPDKIVWLTFDDGYADVYNNALPLLTKYSQKATFYIITGKVGESGYLNWPQISELKDAGMEIGCHSKTHPNLTTLGLEDLTAQIAGCKKELEEKLSTQIISFAYPAGEYNDSVAQKVKELGFTNAITTKNAIANQKSDLFKLPRLRINSDTSLNDFEKMINK